MADAALRNFTIILDRSIRQRMGCCALCWNSTVRWSSVSTPYRPAPSRHRKVDRAQDLSAGVALLRRLDYVAPMNQEHAFCLATEKLLGIAVPKRGTHPRALLRNRQAALAPAQHHHTGNGRRRPDAAAMGFEERENSWCSTSALPVLACTPIIFVSAACIRITARPGRRYLGVLRSVFEGVRRSRGVADRQPHFQTAQRRDWRGQARRCMAWDFPA